MGFGILLTKSAPTVSRLGVTADARGCHKKDVRLYDYPIQRITSLDGLSSKLAT